MKSLNNKRKNFALSGLLLVTMALNMSWVQQFLLDGNTQMGEVTSSANFSSNDVAVSASNASADVIQYHRQVEVKAGNQRENHNWTVDIKKTLSDTNAWGEKTNSPPKEVWEVSAQVEGCYGRNCHVSETIIPGTSSNGSSAQQIVAQVQKVMDRLIDGKSLEIAKEKEQQRLDEEKAKKEAKKQEKLEEDIANCIVNEDTGKKFRSAIRRLQCRADKLGNKEDEEALAEFDDIREDLHSLLNSSNPRDVARAKKILSNMRGDGSIDRSIRNQVFAMQAGAYYTSEYPRALQTALTTNNPMQRQIALGKVQQFEQAYRYDSIRFGQSEEASNEFGYWQAQLQNNMNLVLADPRASLTQSGSSPSTSLPSTGININGRLARSGGNYSSPSSGLTGRLGSPVYNPSNPLESRSYGNQSISTIPQVGQFVRANQ